MEWRRGRGWIGGGGSNLFPPPSPPPHTRAVMDHVSRGGGREGRGNLESPQTVSVWIDAGWDGGVGWLK